MLKEKHFKLKSARSVVSDILFFYCMVWYLIKLAALWTNVLYQDPERANFMWDAILTSITVVVMAMLRLQMEGHIDTLAGWEPELCSFFASLSVTELLSVYYCF